MTAHPIEVFTVAELKTIVLIGDYLVRYGKRGFTYRGLRAYWDARKAYKVLEWHTVERIIRRFCRPPYDLLVRRRVKRGTVYYPTTTFWMTYEWLKSQLRSGGGKR